MKWSRCRSDISFSLAAATVSENESFGSISTEDGISYDKVCFTKDSKGSRKKVFLVFLGPLRKKITFFEAYF